MYLKFLNSPSFFELLYKIDRDQAEKHHGSGCPHCGGKLDIANYNRKPRGLLADTKSFNLKFSLCCRTDGCRRRVTLKSIRFMGRHSYVSLSFLLISALNTSRSSQRLCRLFGIDPRTLKRWKLWWRQQFPVSNFWREQKAQLSGFDGFCFKSLWSYLTKLKANPQDSLLQVLRFFMPLNHQNI